VAQHLFEPLLRQALAGLDIGRGVFIGRSLSLQPAQRLDLPDYFPASGGRVEHLPEETLEDQPQGEEPLAAVGTFVGTGKEVGGNDPGQMSGQLLEGALAQLACGAPAQGGKAGGGRRERRACSLTQ